jgi:N-acetylmuramoyl-L-alanine amidase
MDSIFIRVKTLLFLSITLVLADAPTIEIVYPTKGKTIHALQRTFILGRVSPANALFSINGEKVDLYHTGGFLKTLPVTPGNFSFHCEARLPNGTFISKSFPVWIPPPLSPQKTTTLPMFELSASLPAQNFGILLGEEIVFQCKTLPGKIVECSVGNPPIVFPLMEQAPLSSVQGIYRACYPFQKKMENASITFSAPKDPGIKPLALPVMLSVLPKNEYPVVEITGDRVKARVKPDGDYDTFLKKGTFIQQTGFQGHWLRLALSKNHPVFVHKNQSTLHPPTHPLSEAEITKINVREDEQFLHIVFPGMNPINLTWIEYPNEKKIGVRFYQVKKQYLEDTPLSSLLVWHQTDVLQLEIFPNFSPEWGYGVFFEKNNVEIRIKKPLKGRAPSQINICLDPGHGPDSGAIGPTGKMEASCTLPQAFVLRDALEKRGFSVFLTREKHEGPPLEARPKIAVNADLFLSLHYNASGDGADPYKDRGFESYYYNRAGEKLGQKIHTRVAAVTQIKDKKLRFGNFAVCRNEYVPAILLEIDYLIIPEAEERIQNHVFRQTIAEAICAGIEDYLQEKE